MRLPALSELRFVNVFLTETQAKQIGEMQGLQRLTLLACGGLSNRVLANVGRLSNLESFSILKTDSVLRDSDLQQLAALMRLKTLEIDSDAMEPAGVIELQAKLPGCKITVSPKVQKAIDESREKR